MYFLLAKNPFNDVCGLHLKGKLFQIVLSFGIGMLIDFATLLPWKISSIWKFNFSRHKFLCSFCVSQRKDKMNPRVVVSMSLNTHKQQ